MPEKTSDDRILRRALAGKPWGRRRLADGSGLLLWYSGEHDLTTITLPHGETDEPVPVMAYFGRRPTEIIADVIDEECEWAHRTRSEKPDAMWVLASAAARMEAAGIAVATRYLVPPESAQRQRPGSTPWKQDWKH